MAQREAWNSRFGLILAMAGNAIGLGNLLRFPVQVAENGGGAFMIPYFIAFLLLAMPLMWIEWTIGRHGGKFHHGSLPGMFDALWNHPIAKYLGAIGLFVSTVIFIYYTYIESWTLGFAYFSLTKEFFGEGTIQDMSAFLSSYQGSSQGHFNNIGMAYFFLIITIVLNFWLLYKGISEGIEKLAKIALPAIFVFGLGLMIYIFFIGTPDPSIPENNVWNGLAFIWNPDFSQMLDSKVWLAAAGQVFFTLSVGMGTLQAYASYLKENDDVALSGVATASLNEFAEVVIGGSVAIPIAVAFFGVTTTIAIAHGGSFNLGFVSLAVIFQKIPYGNIIGAVWFLLLFFAGITSSVAMAQPLISFMKEQFQISHKKAVTITGIGLFVCIQFVVLFLKHGFLDEMDYWAGTFALVLIALIEVILFAWIFGIDNGWKELNRGSEIKIPNIFKFIIKYVTPLYILFILAFWTIDDAIPTLLMEGKNPADIPYLWGARGMMLVILLAMVVLIFKGWQRNKFEYAHFEKRSK
ncbi:MAG TPA: sodium-dependent transporter [Candidatus Kapabacteria bacterium]|nr:sodium-dependent transporter [Candidatus Kapabacteria bacterium]